MIALDAYLRNAFELAKSDPPDSDYQRGYHAALVEVAKVFHPELVPKNPAGA